MIAQPSRIFGSAALQVEHREDVGAEHELQLLGAVISTIDS